MATEIRVTAEAAITVPEVHRGVTAGVLQEALAAAVHQAVVTPEAAAVVAEVVKDRVLRHPEGDS